jgi:hypothetical protein
MESVRSTCSIFTFPSSIRNPHQWAETETRHNVKVSALYSKYMANENPDDEQNPSPPATPPTPKPRSSAAIVSDDSAKAIRKLQEQISELQDSRDMLKQENQDLLSKFNELSKIPSTKLPGKTLWQELDELVFGPKK